MKFLSTYFLSYLIFGQFSKAGVTNQRPAYDRKMKRMLEYELIALLTDILAEEDKANYHVEDSWKDRF